jgi:hypothetical protein
MYPRCDLQRDERILFDAPVMLGGFLSSKGGHLFVTNQRIIALPIRFYGKIQTIALEQLSNLAAKKSGLGWPFPRRSITLIASGRTLKLRAWTGPSVLSQSFMGTISGDAFISGVLDAVQRAGWTPSPESSDF